MDVPVSPEALVLATHAAGRLALRRRGLVSHGEEKTEVGGGDARYRAEKGHITEVDHVCQQVLLEKIGSAASTKLGVFAEERDERTDELIAKYFASRDRFDKWTLLVDSIDGTRNYATASPSHEKHLENRGKQDFWGVSVCVLRGTDPALGAIYYPALDLTLATEAGRGTFINGKRARLEKSEREESDLVRISGADAALNALRKVLPEDRSPPGSFVVTLLSLLQLSEAVPALAKRRLPRYSAYVGRNVSLYDLGCAPLAYREASGAVLNSRNAPTNPYRSARRDDSGLFRIGELFVFAPSVDYARSLGACLAGKGVRLTGI